MTLRIRSLFMCLLLSSFVAACGCDAPLADVDGGTDAAGLDATLDAPMRDTGPPDLGDCPDEDGDGSRAAACGGDDCDDADAARYPGGSELCDYAGHDEDCNDATYGTKDDDADGYVDARCCNGTTAKGPTPLHLSALSRCCHNTERRHGSWRFTKSAP